MGRELNSRGITLWLIEQVPESNNIFTAREFYLHKKYPALNPHYSQFTVSLADHLDRQKNAKTAIAGVSSSLIKVIDPAPLFFQGNDRLRVFDDRAYYRDGNHLTQSGIEHYLDKLVEEMIQKIAVETASDNEVPERSEIK